MARKKSKSIGNRLFEALTRDQVVRLLDVLLAHQDKRTRKDILDRLDDDISFTLSELFAPGTQAKEPAEAPAKPAKKRKKKRTTSNAKLVENWNTLWDEWGDIAFEVGSENGRYAYQDNHWDPPYFDGSALADDLDEVAEKMLPMIEEIFLLEAEDSNVFADAIGELECRVRSYPEWMGADCDGFYLAEKVTRAVLGWEWLDAASSDNPGEVWLKRVLDIEGSFSLASLHPKTVVEYATSLPEAARKQVYGHIAGHKNNTFWEKALRDKYSTWHKIHHALSRVFDSGTHLETCEKMLSGEWSYGLPLIEEALRQDDYPEAERVIKRTLASYSAGTWRKTVWDPETTLLGTYLTNGYHRLEEEMPELLEKGIQVAGKLGKDRTKAAFEIQLAIAGHPYKWDDCLAVFRKMVRGPHADMASGLFKQWQDLNLEDSLSYHGADDEAAQESWIHWLLESALAGEDSRGEFGPKMEEWLETLARDADEFKARHRLLYVFTSDMARLAPLEKEWPYLFKYVLSGEDKNSDRASSRQAWLAKMRGERFSGRLKRCWQDNVAVLVPDPSGAHKSRYDYHAKWLEVVREINPAAYWELIKDWRIAHKRRRNLWKAVDARDLPL